jgi:hypothetical protein
MTRGESCKILVLERVDGEQDRRDEGDRDGMLWTNPNTFLKFDVKDDTGKVTHWSCEWNAPSTLVHRQVTQRGC